MTDHRSDWTELRALTVAHQKPGECATCDARWSKIVKACVPLIQLGEDRTYRDWMCFEGNECKHKQRGGRLWCA